MKDCLALNSHFGILHQTIYSLEQKLDGRLHATLRLRNSLIIPISLHIKDCLALNSHLVILQTSSSSKPYIILSRNLMGGSRQMSYTKKLNFIPLRSQRGSSIKQPSWNSLNNIFFQTIYLLEHKLDGRLLAT